MQITYFKVLAPNYLMSLKSKNHFYKISHYIFCIWIVLNTCHICYKILMNLCIVPFCCIEWVVGLHVCLGITYMSGVDRGRKSAQDSLELEVPGDVSHHVGAGNHTLLL